MGLLGQPGPLEPLNSAGLSRPSSRSCPIYHSPMTRLSAPDLAIVAVYIAGMTLLGVYFTRKQKDLRTYFVGGRSIGWFMILMSIVATETSAVTFLSVPGVAYNPEGGNLTFLQLAFGYIVGRCLVA